MNQVQESPLTPMLWKTFPLTYKSAGSDARWSHDNRWTEMAQLVFVVLAFNLILMLTNLGKKEKKSHFLDSFSEVTSGFRSLPDVELPSSCIVSGKGQEMI